MEDSHDGAVQRPPSTVRVVPDLLRRSARLVPDRPAVVLAGGATLSFAEVERRSNAFAHGLRARGVGRGDRLALLHGGADWPDYLVAYFGALKAGAVALLIGDRFTDDDLCRLVAGQHVAGVVQTAARPAPQTGCWAADSAAIEAGRPTDGFPIAAEPGDPAEVIFTSGTTAVPRGVVATHANLVHARAAWPTGVAGNQPCAHALPVGSVAAQVVLLNCVGAQHTLLVLAEFTVAGLVDLVEQQGATTVCLVPAMGHWLVRAKAAEVRPLPSVRGVSFSGAALPTAIMADLPSIFPRAAFYNFYTSTEAYPARVATRFDPRRPESVGRPVGTSAVRITGDDGVTFGPDRVGPEHVGEVWLRAAGAPPRRLLDPHQAPVAAGTVRDGWVRTGDLGHLDADGYLHLDGRTSDIAIVGGFNVSLGRVEQVLTRHEAVAEAAVFAADHPVLGEVVAALVVLRADATVRDLRRHAAALLPRRELPAIIRLVEEIPSSPAGKVVKRHLPRLLDAPGAAGFVPPGDEVERELAAIWAAVLDLGMVSVADNFFEIGGDSLAATRIAAEARERLGVALDAVDVFEAPTVAELAKQVHTTEGNR